MTMAETMTVEPLDLDALEKVAREAMHHQPTMFANPVGMASKYPASTLALLSRLQAAEDDAARWKADAASEFLRRQTAEARAQTAKQDLKRARSAIRKTIRSGALVAAADISRLEDALTEEGHAYEASLAREDEWAQRADESEARAQAAEADLKRKDEALGQIERMKLFPDDKINRTTLQAAIHIARSALQPQERSNDR